MTRSISLYHDVDVEVFHHLVRDRQRSSYHDLGDILRECGQLAWTTYDLELAIGALSFIKVYYLAMYFKSVLLLYGIGQDRSLKMIVDVQMDYIEINGESIINEMGKSVFQTS